MRAIFQRAAGAVATTALTAALAGPACANDVTSVTAKIASAAAGVKSFVVQMRVTGTTGVNGSLTFVRPMSMKSDFSMGQLQVETYMVDGTLYVHSPAGGWQKMTIDPAKVPQQSANIADTLKMAKVTLLPDRHENGTTVGVIEVETQLPAVAGPMAQAGPQKVVCSYDKASFLMNVCTNSLMTMTYTKYNDPANAVVLPADAKSAVPMVLPSMTPGEPASPGPASATPLPAATPGPSPSPA